MENLLSLFPILITISVLSAIIAFFFLQSRAQGLARLLIIISGLFMAVPELCVIMFGKNLDKIVSGLVAAGGTNIGIILLSVGVILFAISLPSKRLRLKADDRRMLSDQIIKDMAENRHL